MMKKRKLGIIGGSGLYKMEGFEKPKWKKIETPWGSPSDSVMTAKFYGNDICFRVAYLVVFRNMVLVSRILSRSIKNTMVFSYTYLPYCHSFHRFQR